MAINNSMDAAQRGIDLAFINSSSVRNDSAIAPRQQAEEQPQPATASVALRASTGQAKIANALTRAEAVALYREVAAML